MIGTVRPDVANGRQLIKRAAGADLLHPESPIGPDQLAPTVLSATLEEVAVVLQILDPEQCAELADQAIRLLEERAAQGVDVAPARQRLDLILTSLEVEDAPRH